MSRPLALVTGASSGIGLELARLLAADGHDLMLVARRGDVLRAVADELTERHGAACAVVPADLSEPTGPGRVVGALEDDGRPLEVLVNNAGFAVYGRFLETDWDAERAMIQLNVTALTELTKRLAPGMARRGRGRILNVASTAAFQPGPLMAVYYATKAYVLHLSVALSVELEGSGVSVTTLCPGPTRTGFSDAAGMGDSRLFAGGRGMDAATVARQGYDAMWRGRPLVVPGAWNRVLALASRCVPRAFAARLALRVQAPVDGRT